MQSIWHMFRLHLICKKIVYDPIINYIEQKTYNILLPSLHQHHLVLFIRRASIYIAAINNATFEHHNGKVQLL
jgi:hypothetical protein